MHLARDFAMCSSKGIAETHNLNLYLDPGPDHVDPLSYFHSLWTTLLIVLV